MVRGEERSGKEEPVDPDPTNSQSAPRINRKD